MLRLCLAHDEGTEGLRGPKFPSERKSRTGTVPPGFQSGFTMSAEEVRHENSQRRTSPPQAPDVLCDAFLLRLPPLHLQSTLRVRPPPTHGSPLTCPSASLSLVPRRQHTAQPPLRHTHGIEEPVETPNAPSSTRQKKTAAFLRIERIKTAVQNVACATVASRASRLAAPPARRKDGFAVPAANFTSKTGDAEKTPKR